MKKTKCLTFACSTGCKWTPRLAGTSGTSDVRTCQLSTSEHYTCDHLLRVEFCIDPNCMANHGKPKGLPGFSILVSLDMPRLTALLRIESILVDIPTVFYLEQRIISLTKPKHFN